MTIYGLVLPALPACFLAYLASYGRLLAACWLVGWFFLLSITITGLFSLPCLPDYWLGLSC
jgi:hypothetical protein